MSQKSKQIDAYIAKSKDFAKPVMNHFRDLVHKTCPEVEEKMKWSFPHFDYKGKMMCSMAAFKEHCAISFWKAPLLEDKKLQANAKSESAMGHFGRITSLRDLPSDKIMAGYIKEAMKLNDAGIVVARPKPDENKKKELIIPKVLIAAINKNKKAKAVWEKASYSFKKEYAMWIDEAKTDATREKRLETALEWISENKSRNWKYER